MTEKLIQDMGDVCDDKCKSRLGIVKLASNYCKLFEIARYQMNSDFSH